MLFSENQWTTDNLLSGLLNEGAGSSDHPMAKAIIASPLKKAFQTIRVVEAGERQTGTQGNMNFVRFVLGNGKEFEFVEFLSKDPSFKTVDGVVMYRDHVPERTAYLKTPAPTDKFLASLYEQSHPEVSLRESGMNTLVMVTSILTSLFGLMFMGKWLWQNIISSRDEDHAKVTAEQRLNEFLFQGQKKDEAVFDIYKTTVGYIHNLIDGKGRGVVLYGMPGTSKTYIVRRTLYFAKLTPDKDYVIVKGSSASAEQNIKIIYSTLYKYNGKIIVFDDFDSALEDNNVINLLKAALDSYPVRIVSMPDLSQFSMKDEPLPSRFEFTGKIIIITNKMNIDTAILSRVQSVKVTFTPEQFKDSIGKMLKFINPEVPQEIKKEVFDYFTDCLAKDPNLTIDFRRFSAMVDIRMAYPDTWKDQCLGILYPKT
jgi:hypothetical protein